MGNALFSDSSETALDGYGREGDSDDDTFNKGGSNESGVVILRYADAASGAWIAHTVDTGSNYGGGPYTETPPTIDAADIDSGDFLCIVVVVVHNSDYGDPGFTPPSGFDEDIDSYVGSAEWWAGGIGVFTALITGHDDSTDYTPPDFTTSTGAAYVMATILIETGSAVTLEQTHFRFYEDDGSESGSTAAAAEDTDISAPAGETKRLRVQIDADGDPDSQGYKLQFERDTVGNWQDVPT